MVTAMAFLMAQAALGEQVFAKSCAVGYCHGTAGAASRAPKLHGRSFQRSYLVKTVQDGLPGTAMPGFAKSLSAAEINAVLDYIATVSTVTGAGTATAAGPSAAPPGRALFFDATRGTRCGTCHIAEGQGIAIGPELKGTVEMPRGGRSKLVRTLRTPEGDTIQGIPVDQSRFWDLSSMTPVLRSEGAAVASPGNWAHESVVKNYTAEELAAIQGYLRWLGSRKGK